MRLGQMSRYDIPDGWKKKKMENDPLGIGTSVSAARWNEIKEEFHALQLKALDYGITTMILMHEWNIGDDMTYAHYHRQGPTVTCLGMMEEAKQDIMAEHAELKRRGSE